MEWTPWQQVVALLGGMTAFTSALAWVARKAIDSFIAGRLESYKLHLQLQADEFKASLERTNKEHSVRFERYHDKRAESIDEMYRHMAALGKFVSLVSRKEMDDALRHQSFLDMMQALTLLDSSFSPRRHYLAKDMCDKMTKLIRRAHAVGSGLSALIEAGHPSSELTPEEWEQAWATELVKSSLLGESIQESILALEQEFRVIVGVG